MKHYVYKLTNNKTGLYYIGSRTHPSPENDEYLGSSKVINNIIRLEGKDIFTKIILSTHTKRSEANAQENLLVLECLKNEPKNTYNLRIPGYFVKGKEKIYNKRTDIWNDYYNIIRQKYIEGLNLHELAKIYGCDLGTIKSVVDDIKRPKIWSKAWLTQEQIVDEYIKGKSRKLLSKEYKCDIGTIKTILQQNHIGLRTVKEQYKINTKNNIKPGKIKEINLIQFKKLYLEDNLTLRETAKKLGLYEGTLKKIAINNNIPIKNREYYCKNRKQRHSAWKQIKEIKKDLEIINKKEILRKYNIKDYSTLNKILNQNK